MKSFKYAVLIFLLTIVSIACESEEHKHFRESCRSLEIRIIPEVKANWRKHLRKALLREKGNDQIYYYFKDIISKPDSILEIYVDEKKINQWEHNVSDHPGMPGVYSAVLTRFFHEKNEYGQMGDFTIRFSKSGVGNWRIIDYELGVL